MMISNEGHTIACKRLFSYFSQEGSYQEAVSGLTYYKFIADIERNYESRIADVKKTFRS